MASKTKRRAAKRARPVQHPQRPTAQSRPWWLYAAATVGLVGFAVAAALIAFKGGGSSGEPASSAGLPDTPDYHSLLVSPTNPQELTLGTHYGLYRSIDGGRSWRTAGLSDSDAMNLVRTKPATVWLAGHNVLKKSTDGGSSWNDVRPAGLPGLDVHGFAVNPSRPAEVYAAIAGQGLYRSTDAGSSFQPVSTSIGPAVMGLAVTPTGTVFAADMQRGLIASSNGRSGWSLRLGAQTLGVAVQPTNPKRILATADGIYLSTNGGQSFHQVEQISSGAGPVAWAASDPEIAYVVGFDKQLYRTADGGASWTVG